MRARAGAASEAARRRHASDRQAAAAGFAIVGLTGIVECSIAWLNRNRQLSKDYQYRVQSSETMLAIAAIRPMLNRLAVA